MKNLDDREYNNVYAIPANYTDSGKLLGGMIDTRTAIGVDGGSLFQYIGHIIHFWTHRRKLHFRRIGYRYGQSKRKKKPQKRKA